MEDPPIGKAIREISFRDFCSSDMEDPPIGKSIKGISLIWAKISQSPVHKNNINI